MSVSVVTNNVKVTGESPFWDPISKSLLYVDQESGDVHKWDSLTGEDYITHFEGHVGFVIPRQMEGYVIGLNQSIASFNWGSNEHDVLAEFDQGKDTTNNDAKCDLAGRLWFGSCGMEVPRRDKLEYELKQGSLYSLDKDHNIRKHLTEIDLSNGLAWSADNNVMYYIDSMPRKLYAFDFDINAGNISNQRVVVDFNKESIDVLGYPDGMCIDNEGKLWVACFLGGKVIRFDPQTGTQLQTLKFPARRITSCCFGGKDMDDMFVTSTRFDDEKELKREPLGGAVFRVSGLGVTGIPATKFEG